MINETATLEQGTQSWLYARCGLVTASRLTDVMAKTKTRGGEAGSRTGNETRGGEGIAQTGNEKAGYSASRASYMASLVIERLTGKPVTIPTTRPMQQGTEREPQARASYELFTGHEVVETGFHIHPTIDQSGASPDGLVGDDGLVEIKCPQPAAHLDIVLNQKIPSKYQLQMQWQMACTGRKWCDFISFNPDFPDELAGIIIHLPRDDALIHNMEKEVTTFLAELEDKMKRLDELKSKIAKGETGCH